MSQITFEKYTSQAYKSKSLVLVVANDRLETLI